MRLLHTSDWHVGKRIRGHSRADEHRAVLAEIVSVAAEESVDLIVVAGDLYETAAPTPESELIVHQALLGLAEIAPVMAIAGNHDNPRRLAAVEPLMSLGRITMVAEPRPPADGGAPTITTGSGTPVRVAMLPFVSQRSIVRADELMANAGFENAQSYADRLQRVIAALCAGFDADHVNLVVAHAFVHGGSLGGGERPAHLVDEYALSAVDFPATASYVALGHLHRPQQMLGATAIHYCGSPLQLDFGEQEQAKQVNVVDVEPGLPAKVQPVRLRSGRRLRTVTGTVAELAAIAEEGPAGADDGPGRAFDGDADGDADGHALGSEGTRSTDEERPFGDDWLRVRVTEPGRAGLAEEVRSLLGPGVVDVRVEQQHVARPRSRREGRSPRQLFVEYLSEVGVGDARLEARFAELYEDAGRPADDPVDGTTGAR